MANIILTDEMGARLENAIFIRGWSLRDFAKKSGVSVSAISRYVNGEVKKVNARTIYKFATTLGTTVDWLRWGCRQKRPKGECKSCRHRDPEDKKCDCGRQERQGCPFPVSDDYYCKYYEKGGAK